MSIIVGCIYHDIDPDLEQPDGDGGTVLTPLGCLVNGPWNIILRHGNDGYNEELFVNDSLISSIGMPYTNFQKDFVFELQKGGKIKYWFKSENDWLADSIKSHRDMTNSTQKKEENLKHIHSSGFWKANFKDSTLIIHFENDTIPEFNFKWIDLGFAYANFRQVFYFDSIYNNRKTTFKKAVTVRYETLYPIL